MAFPLTGVSSLKVVRLLASVSPSKITSQATRFSSFPFPSFNPHCQKRKESSTFETSHNYSELLLKARKGSPVFSQRSFQSMAARAQSEESAAASAAVLADTGAPTIFDKIISKEIPATIVFEDDLVLAFRDINPQAPTHIVLIPKQRDGLTQLSKAEPRHKDILGHMLLTVSTIAKSEGLSPDGFRLVINDGPTGCQSVYHLHMHIIGGRQMKWPPG